MEPKEPPVQWVPVSILPVAQRLWCANLTADSHIVPSLRMSGALPPSPYAFMAFTGTSLPKHSVTPLRHNVKLTLKQAMKTQKGVEVFL
jgi:hypothetical protein